MSEERRVELVALAAKIDHLVEMVRELRDQQREHDNPNEPNSRHSAIDRELNIHAREIRMGKAIIAVVGSVPFVGAALLAIVKFFKGN